MPHASGRDGDGARAAGASQRRSRADGPSISCLRDWVQSARGRRAGPSEPVRPVRGRAGGPCSRGEGGHGPGDRLPGPAVSGPSGGERGLLGLAFAPDYASSGRFFVNFTNAAGHTVIARFRRSSDPLIADPTSRFDLRMAAGLAVIAQPFSNHNGGHLAFGPDGYLYIGLGDGGSGDDPGHRAQNPSELLGKMLRIDVNVPDSDVRPAIACRPTTRSSARSRAARCRKSGASDCATHGGTPSTIRRAAGRARWSIGDVGQNRWEEIDYEPARRGGRNYGWRNREGLHNNVTSLPPAFQPLVDPILRVRPCGGRIGDRRIRLSGRARSAARFEGGTCLPISSRGGSGRLRSRSTQVATPARPIFATILLSLAPQVPSVRSASMQTASSTWWRIQPARCCG